MADNPDVPLVTPTKKVKTLNDDKQYKALLWLYISYIISIILTTVGFMLTINSWNANSPSSRSVRIATSVLVASTILVQFIQVWA